MMYVIFLVCSFTAVDAVTSDRLLSRLVFKDKVPSITPVVEKSVSSLIQCQLFCLKNKECCKYFSFIPSSENSQMFSCQIMDSQFIGMNEKGKFKKSVGSAYYEVIRNSNHVLQAITKKSDQLVEPTKADNLVTKINDQSTKPSRDPNCFKWLNHHQRILGKLKNVCCDKETDGGGWLIFQKRLDGSVNFDKNWVEYKNGFGSASSSFWLGNEYLHQLTSAYTDGMELFVESTTYDGEKQWAKFRSFKIKSEDYQYELQPLTIISSLRDGCGRDFKYSSNKFSTRDRDHDGFFINCAEVYTSGWWFKDCFLVNFNGKYLHKNKIVRNRKAILWSNCAGKNVPLKTTRMMVRPYFA